jgi:hydrogenase expression/formation protein HypE
MDERILLGHGSGGKLMSRLIRETLLPAIDNEVLRRMGDAAVIDIEGVTFAFTTDSYVISPLFFPGGDIGRLAVCGTVNDLCVSGARPLFLSVGLIIEEGFPLASLERINRSLGAAACEAAVQVVTGDTKVVNRGGADGLFINTSGIGVMRAGVDTSGCRACAGDRILVNGTMGDHGIAVMAEREGLLVESPVISDVAPLNHMLDSLFAIGAGVRFLRDPTRGGLATALNEFASATGLGVELWGNQIPVRPEVRGVCELLGLDPLYVANEGKCVAVVARELVEAVLESWRSHPLGREAQEIGRVTAEPAGKVTLRTEIGGTRIVDTLVGEQLPRIC